MNLEDMGLPLGKTVAMPDHFSPDHLAPVPRSWARERENVDLTGFVGFDEWNLFEVSWLDMQGKPVMSTGRYTVPHDSPNLIESKSIKLYLNSMNNTRLGDDRDAVASRVAAEMSQAAGKTVSVEFFAVGQGPLNAAEAPVGECLDDANLIAGYELDESICGQGEESVVLYTDAFRSLCPVTAQPDWATVLIQYEGPRLDRDRLYSYLMSFRNHQGFHEACCERIACEINRIAQPQSLQVEARFLRRGGVDINPVRALSNPVSLASRLPRQ